MGAHNMPRLLGLNPDPHEICDRALSREAEATLNLTRELEHAHRRLAEHEASRALLLRLLDYTDTTLVHVRHHLRGTRQQQAQARALADLADEYPARLRELADQHLAAGQQEAS